MIRGLPRRFRTRSIGGQCEFTEGFSSWPWPEPLHLSSVLAPLPLDGGSSIFVHDGSGKGLSVRSAWRWLNVRPMLPGDPVHGVSLGHGHRSVTRLCLRSIRPGSPMVASRRQHSHSCQTESGYDPPVYIHRSSPHINDRFPLLESISIFTDPAMGYTPLAIKKRTCRPFFYNSILRYRSSASWLIPRYKT